ncbi:MAG: secondary thiamine-phosphate synthase enzyme YjbQ [Candidatus Omnitrophica bacterium]|nr:secondary thiamine-phosphate synthase enzyme YjbQ [Candidatus Omnitrophota bacterium]
MVITEYIAVQTRGHTDVIDITPDCRELIRRSGLNSGIITVFNPGSTGGISTIEYEPNLIKDLRDSLEVVSPSDKVYEHSKTWHDDNGSAHIRSTLMGPSLSVPFCDGELTLGTWQQIIFCDFDTRPRERRLVAQLIGE